MNQHNENIVRFEQEVRNRIHDEHELLAILFTDLVDSTQLQTDHGDTESVRLSDTHREIVRRLLQRYGGREIDWAGDSCLAAFTKPSAAVLFALEMLAEHRDVRKSEALLPQVRVGIHLGEIVVRNMEGGGRDSKDLFGLQVSEAARVMSLARGDQIFCTKSVFDSARLAMRGKAIDTLGELNWINHGLYDLKGSPEPIEICEVGETEHAPLRAPESNDKCVRVSGVSATSPSSRNPLTWMAASVVILVAAIAVFASGKFNADTQPTEQKIETAAVALPGLVTETPKEARVYNTLLPPDAPVAPPETVLNFNLAVAPDGKHFVYRSLDGAVAHLVVSELGKMGATVLQGTEGARFPFFSPDSQWIGYFSTEDQKLKKVPVDGGPPIALCGGFFYAGADWGDDGFIVFSHGGQGIMRVSEDGGEAVRLTKPDPKNGETFHSHPHVLPDGNGILFSVSPAIDVSTMKTALLKPGDTEGSFESEYAILEGTGGTAQYLPTGHLLYIKFGQLIAQPFDLESLAFTGDPVPVTQYAMVGKDGTTRHYGYSRDGTLIYVPDYGEEIESNELAWIHPNGEMTSIGLQPKSYVIPRVSPDGTRIAVSAQEAVGRDIWICNLEDASQTRLTFDKREDWHPIWSRDGKNVVFSSGRDGVLNLYMKAADGTGEVKRITTSEHHQWPHTWSGDGKELVYVEGGLDTGYDIWAVPVDGSAPPRPMLQTPTNENNPDISPDGKWIAYQSNESGQYEIYIQDYPGFTGKWQVSESGGNQVRWSPDGKTVYFRHGVQMLKAVITPKPTMKISNPEVVIESDAVVLASEARNYDIGPDGEQFLVLKPIESGAKSTLNRELFIVENWFEEIKRLAPPEGA